MRTLRIFVGIMVIAGSLVYFFLKKPAAPSDIPLVNPSSVQRSPSESGFSQPTPDTSILKAGGSSYRDPEGLYVFLYPNDYVMDTNDPKHIRIYKKGETQRPQSEMSDGALIVFESIDLQSQSLETWVDNRISESTADGTQEVIQPKKATALNTYPGFIYEMRGLGTATYLVFQKNSKSPSALSVTFSISDPQQKNYKNDIDAVLNTIELLK